MRNSHSVAERKAGILQVESIRKTYPDSEPVLRDVSFQAESGDAIAVVGPSGSGKSTLLHILGSLETASGGRVLLGDTDVTSLDGDRLSIYRAREVGFVFQDHHLLPQLTARENALLPSLAAYASSADRERAAARIDDLLEQAGVAARADAFPAALSGGERQRVAIVRALGNEPRLLLCDEPTGNLDQETGEAIADLFLSTARQQRATVVMVTHNMELARRFPRCYRLAEGRLTEIPE